MKWFCALNSQSRAFAAYAQMVKVAVHTAQTRTTLEPHFLYDGPACALTDWLTERGVGVHPCVTRFRPLLHALSARSGSSALEAAAGAFLRAELPGVMQAAGYTDPFALYTDCDVLFVSDPAPVLHALHPPVFAVAPEFSPTDWRGVNTGVMLMNLNALRASDAAWTRFTARHMAQWMAYSWDQAAFQAYYHPLCRLLMDRNVPYRWAVSAANRLRRFVPPRWDRLPLALNWKPYWGPSADARIVHFHGPKPTSTMAEASAPDDTGHGNLAGGDFAARRQEWRRLLTEADPAEILVPEPDELPCG